jgi:hypothetical protein
MYAQDAMVVSPARRIAQEATAVILEADAIPLGDV